MSTYKGWAIKLKNGKFMNDGLGRLGPLTCATRREARWYQSDLNVAGESTVVRVTVTVKECKP